MLIKLCIFLLMTIPAIAVPDTSIRKEIFNSLPKDIASLTKKTKADDIQKKFSGKINKSEDNTYYMTYFSGQNDLTIGIENKHFKYAYVKVPSEIRKKNKNLFMKIYQDLSPEEKKKLVPKDISHDSGRYIEVKLPEQALTLKFKNNKDKDLHSIIFWTPGDKKP